MTVSWIDIVGAIIGVAYIISEYRADRWFWPLSLVMSAFYIVIDFTSGIYANGAICCYNFIMSIYGILVWRGLVQSKNGGERPITSCPRRYWPALIATTVALSVGLWWLLGWLGESQYPWLDGISSALTIVAMWMLARKWVEQWLVWLVVDAISTGLYIYKGIPFYAILYAIYTVIAWFGYRKWLRQMRES